MSMKAGNDVKGKDKPRAPNRIKFAPQSTPDETRPLLDDDIDQGNEQDGEDVENGAVHRLHRKSKLGLLLGNIQTRRPSYSQLDEGERTNLTRRRWLTYAVGWTFLALVVVGVIVGAMLLDNSDHPTGPYPGPPHHSVPPTSTFSIPPNPYPTGLPRNPAYLIKAANGAVATENKLCSDMGVDILKASAATSCN